MSKTQVMFKSILWINKRLSHKLTLNGPFYETSWTFSTPESSFFTRPNSRYKGRFFDKSWGKWNWWQKTWRVMATIGFLPHFLSLFFRKSSFSPGPKTIVATIDPSLYYTMVAYHWPYTIHFHVPEAYKLRELYHIQDSSTLTLKHYALILAHVLNLSDSKKYSRIK